MGQRAVISTNNIKELYAGVENEVSIALPNTPCNDIQLSASQCKVTGSGCNYIIIPSTDTNNAATIITIRNKKKSVVADTIGVPVKHINDLLVRISESSLNRGRVMKNGPSITSKDCPIIEKFFQIAEFNVTILRDTAIIFDHRNVGSRFDKESLDALGKTKKGDKLYIEEIKVIGPDKTYRKMATISHTF
jgi:hypothetical protein